MVNTPKLVTNPNDVAAIAEALRRADMVGVDTEFIRETTFFPKIALFQLATEDKAWLVDPTALNASQLQPILDVMKDKAILKVMHAAYADQECLYWAYGFVAEPVIDTAVAAALTGFGDNVGLGKLLREVLHVSLPKGRARVKWLQRPLSADLLQYAEQDVAHLVSMTKILVDKLKRKGRWEWAMEESFVPPSSFETPPEDMAKRIAKSGNLDSSSFPVLVELLRWREDRARQANMPRGWVAENEILVALAKVQPTSLEQLRTFRGLNAKEIDRSGMRILEAVKTGRRAPSTDFVPPTRQRPEEHQDHLHDFIRTYISFLADRHEIALRFLINTGKAQALAMNPTLDTDAWVREGILSPHAVKLIGDELRELLSGKRGLVLRNGKVEILALN